MAVVEVRSLTKRYGRITALDDVSFDVPPGVTGLLGPNGAGKSTLLLCVLGLLPSWRGEVRVLGLDARRERRAIRRRVGFMPELDAWLPDMTGIRAVRHLGRLAGLRSADALRRAHEVLWHVGLGEAVYRPLAEYSSGMRQRFKLAQALVHDPEVLFLDEPLGGMDPAGRDELLVLARDLARLHDKHVVWSSHILPEVQKVADQVVVLDRGRFRGSLSLADVAVDENRVEVVVDGAADPEAVVAAWRRAGLDVRDAATPGGRALSSHRFVITIPVDRSVADLFRLARLAGARLRRVAPVRTTLDEMFQRLLEDGPRAEVPA